MIASVPYEKFPTTQTMIALWNREWSSTAIRWANHRLKFVLNVHGHDILEDETRYRRLEK